MVVLVATCQIDKRPDMSPRHAWPMSSTMPPLAPLPTAPACARAFVSITLSSWGLDDLAESADLIVSELVTNAVRASHPYYRDTRIEVIRVCLFGDGTRVVIEVWDEAAGVPVIRDAGEFEEGGRGLTLVDAIADKWGWVPAARRTGKCVWAELSTTSALSVLAGNALYPSEGMVIHGGG